MNIERIEALVKKHLPVNWFGQSHTMYADMERCLSSALTEQAETHAIELRKRDERIRQLEKERALLKPAQIGATRFLVGVKERLVIDRAQREYEHRQLEKERAPDGWRFDRCSDGTINVIKDSVAGVNIGKYAENARRIPEEVLWMLANDMLAAAPQPKESAK